MKGRRERKAEKSPEERRRYPIGTDPQKNKQKIQAVVRQEEYDKLVNDERVARAESRRGESKRELARLRKEKS